MKYALALLTHGSGRTFRRACESFAENVSPAPAAVTLFADAMPSSVFDETVRTATGIFALPLGAATTHPPRQAGFCGATARLWKSAAELTDVDYVVWLEHDFVFLRPLILDPLAALLDGDHGLAQVSLIRDGVNEAEVKAGGIVASRPGEFQPRQTDGYDWLEQRSYFTTNPSLMRRAFMAEQPFIDDGAYCEGRYGIRLREQGFRFAAWGDGSEWVAHMGIRDGSGTGY